MRRMTKEVNYDLWSTGELVGGRLSPNSAIKSQYLSGTHDSRVSILQLML